MACVRGVTVEIRSKQLSKRVKQAHARLFSLGEAHEASATCYKELVGELQRLSRASKETAAIATAPASGVASHNTFRLHIISLQQRARVCACAPLSSLGTQRPPPPPPLFRSDPFSQRCVCVCARACVWISERKRKGNSRQQGEPSALSSGWEWRACPALSTRLTVLLIINASLLPACRNRIRIDSSLTAVSKFLLVTLHPLAEPAGLGFGAYSSGRRFRSCRLPACLSTPLVRILVKSSLHSLGLG